MAKPLSEILTPENALIFRITHRSNVRWILENGLRCESSSVTDPNFVSIGNPDLIERRRSRRIGMPPGGTLSDYVPFYFTPFSPMLLNIATGHRGIQKRENGDIAIVVTSLVRLEELGVRFLFTDRHAYLATAKFCSDRMRLAEHVDYSSLQRRDFKADPDDPGKMERYQAEALAYQAVPVEAIQAICCYTRDIKSELLHTCSDVVGRVKILVRNDWYYH